MYLNAHMTSNGAVDTFPPCCLPSIQQCKIKCKFTNLAQNAQFLSPHCHLNLPIAWVLSVPGDSCCFLTCSATWFCPTGRASNAAISFSHEGAYVFSHVDSISLNRSPSFVWSFLIPFSVDSSMPRYNPRSYHTSLASQSKSSSWFRFFRTRLTANSYNTRIIKLWQYWSTHVIGEQRHVNVYIRAFTSSV